MATPPSVEISGKVQAVHIGRHPLDRVAQDLMNQGVTQIVLFGAGRHTRPIVRQPWVRFGISVRLIIDDQPALASMGGVPVVQTGEATLSSEVEAIVISSECYQEQLYARACKAFSHLGIQILKLYADEDTSYDEAATIDRLSAVPGLCEGDASWLVKNRGERHDALLPMLPPERTELHLRRYELAAEIFERSGGKAIADLACGTGYGSTVLAYKDDIQYTGVDIDRDTIQYAKRRYGTDHRQYFCASATAVPMDDQAVDMVASFETIEHIEDTQGLCAQYARVLKPDGILVVSTPNKLGPTPYHVHDFDMQSFVHALSAHFEVMDLIGQLPIDDVFDSALPPGMWRIDTSQSECSSTSPDGRRPDYLIAVAKLRRTNDPL